MAQDNSNVSNDSKTDSKVNEAIDTQEQKNDEMTVAQAQANNANDDTADDKAQKNGQESQQSGKQEQSEPDEKAQTNVVNDIKNEIHNSPVNGNIISASHVKLEQIEQSFHFDGTNLNKQPLTEQHFDCFERQELNFTENLIIDLDNASHCLSMLSQNRLLLLSGEAELGKLSFAQYLSYCLVEKLEIQNNTNIEVLVKQHLEPNFQASLNEICKNTELVTNRVLIFGDAFIAEDSPLKNLQDASFDSYSRRLKENNAFIIITATPPTLTHIWESYANKYTLEKPASEQLKQCFGELFNKYNIKPEDKNSLHSLGDEQEKLLFTRLNTFPKLARFAARFFDRLRDDESFSIVQALEQFTNAATWFLNDAYDQNQHAWRLCLAVLFGHAYNKKNAGTSSYAAHKLAEMLRQHLKSHSFDEKHDTPLPYLKHDSNLLEHARLEYVNTGAGYLRFAESETSQSIWQAILKSGHSLLVHIVPFLQKLVADRRDSYSIAFSENGDELSKSAASSLGRIGVLAPDEIILPFIRKELQNTTEQAFLPISHLFLGIIASNNKHYKETTLQFLFETCKQKNNEGYIFCYMLVLRQIGLTQTNLAINKIYLVINSLLKDIPDKFKQLETNIKKEVNGEAKLHEYLGYGYVSYAEQNEIKKGIMLLILNEAENHQLHVISQFQQDTLFATIFSLTGLCLALDPIQVAHYSMTEKKAKSLYPIAAIIWLDDFGVLAKMKKMAVLRDFEKIGEYRRTDRTLVAIVESNLDKSRHCELHSFTSFLIKLYKSLEEFPTIIALTLKKKLVAHIKAWTISANQTSAATKAILAFYELLLPQIKNNNQQLKEEILNMLSDDQEFQIEPNKTLANRIMALKRNTKSALSRQ